jgi:hypothetical protein
MVNQQTRFGRRDRVGLVVFALASRLLDPLYFGTIFSHFTVMIQGKYASAALLGHRVLDRK